ncbi:MAG TPA: kelch repeat-containing protein [Planctomycetota bacterium]|nr:kelch repeat-containing protein [Planctomycetota bacterium]
MNRLWVSIGAALLFAVAWHSNRIYSDPSPAPLLDVPAGSIVSSDRYGDETLTRAGYTLYGELAGVTSYSHYKGLRRPAGTWALMYDRGVPAQLSIPDQGGAAAWGGDAFYLFQNGRLFAYDPIGDAWTEKARCTISISRGGLVRAVWTGTELIVWGGVYVRGDSGARYNPKTNVWTAISTENQPSPRTDYPMVWCGNRAIIWGGFQLQRPVGDGAMYDPSTNVWTAMSAKDAPTPRMYHTMVCNPANNTLIVWGGAQSGAIKACAQLDSGAIFDPARNVWTGSTTTTGAPAPREGHTAVWSGSEMIVFGGAKGQPVRPELVTLVTYNNGGRYNPAANSWQPLPVSGAPATVHHSAVWTGTSMVVTGGVRLPAEAGYNLMPVEEAAVYDPATNAWRPIPFFASKDPRSHHSSFLGDGILLAWGGFRYERTKAIPCTTGFRYFLRETAANITALSKQTLYLYRKN